MIEIKESYVFQKWRKQLKDGRARGLIASRLDRLSFGHAGDVEFVGVVCASYVYITVRDIVSTFKEMVLKLSYYCVVVTKVLRQEISKQQNAWLLNGVMIMIKKLTTYDPAEDLASDEAMVVFMAEAFETNDSNYVAHALGVVARAKGMTQIAKQTGLSREQLYRSFSGCGNPTLKSTFAVMNALGLDLTAKAHLNNHA